MGGATSLKRCLHTALLLLFCHAPTPTHLPHRRPLGLQWSRCCCSCPPTTTRCLPPPGRLSSSWCPVSTLGVKRCAGGVPALASRKQHHAPIAS